MCLNTPTQSFVCFFKYQVIRITKICQKSLTLKCEEIKDKIENVMRPMYILLSLNYEEKQGD